MDEIELIRSDLIKIEENNEFIDMSNPDKLDPAFVHNVRELIKERLLEGVEEVRITNLGHRFLNAVRGPAAWERVRDRLENTVEDIATVTLEVVVDTAIAMNQPNP